MSDTKLGGLVIVVEDDAMIRRLYTSGLSKMGFTVIATESGEEGLSLLSQHAPKVVILDINLPGIDGIEVCRRTRSMVGGKAPVIFITSNDTVGILQECIEAGGDDFIVKGRPISNVMDRVSYWARGSSRRVTDRQRRMILNKTSAIIEAMSSETESESEDIPLQNNTLKTHPDVIRIVETFKQLQHKWPSMDDQSVKARVRRFGYITGLVNSAAKTSLEMKVQFLDFLKTSMLVSGVLQEKDVPGMFESWHEFYANPGFSDACAAAEQDYAAIYPNE